ncbi:MAG: DMT family transporter [Geminicoccaceae bacterium]
MAVRIAAAGQVRSPMLGIGLALLAFAMFTCMDVFVKLLGERLHVLQVLAMNSVFALLAVVVIGYLRGGLRRLRPRLWGLQLTRWAISYVGTVSIFWCYPRMALADVYAILFASPLLITALSVPVLGETVGWRRWMAVGVGFLGVLVVLAPGSHAFEITALVALLGALAHSMNMLLVRRLGSREPVEVLGLVGNSMTAMVSALALPFVWQSPSVQQVGMSAAAGTIAGSGFLLLAQAFRSTPAAVVAPFQYSQMIYGIVVGLLIFGDVPSSRMLTGALIIVASGLYVLHRERLAVRAVPA